MSGQANPYQYQPGRQFQRPSAGAQQGAMPWLSPQAQAQHALAMNDPVAYQRQGQWAKQGMPNPVPQPQLPPKMRIPFAPPPLVDPGRP